MIDKYKKSNSITKVGKPKNNLGFTVLESIVAIFVLTLAISGAFSAVRQSLHQSTLSKEEVRAFYLAQEAVEIVRNRRDNNQLEKINGSTNSWLYGISSNVDDPCYFGKVCRVDASVSSPFAYCGSNEWGSCENIRQNSTDFRYGHNPSWTSTNFKREIKLEQINSNEIAVIVRMTWSKGLTSKDFTVRTLLFNWIQ